LVNFEVHFLRRDLKINPHSAVEQDKTRNPVLIEGRHRRQWPLYHYVAKIRKPLIIHIWFNIGHKQLNIIIRKNICDGARIRPRASQYHRYDRILFFSPTLKSFYRVFSMQHVDIITAWRKIENLSQVDTKVQIVTLYCYFISKLKGIR
jgi:hypothetical protein